MVYKLWTCVYKNIHHFGFNIASSELIYILIVLLEKNFIISKILKVQKNEKFTFKLISMKFSTMLGYFIVKKQQQQQIYFSQK